MKITSVLAILTILIFGGLFWLLASRAWNFDVEGMEQSFQLHQIEARHRQLQKTDKTLQDTRQNAVDLELQLIDNIAGKIGELTDPTQIEWCKDMIAKSQERLEVLGVTVQTQFVTEGTE